MGSNGGQGDDVGVADRDTGAAHVVNQRCHLPVEPWSPGKLVVTASTLEPLRAKWLL